MKTGKTFFICSVRRCLASSSDQIYQGYKKIFLEENNEKNIIEEKATSIWSKGL